MRTSVPVAVHPSHCQPPVLGPQAAVGAWLPPRDYVPLLGGHFGGWRAAKRLLRALSGHTPRGGRAGGGKSSLGGWGGVKKPILFSFLALFVEGFVPNRAKG